MAQIHDAEYIADILAIDHRIDNKNRELVELTLQIANGALTGTIIKKRYYLMTRKVAEFLKKEMDLIHVTFADKADFDTKMHLAVGKRVAFTAVTNESGNQSFYLSGEITIASPAPSQAQTLVW